MKMTSNENVKFEDAWKAVGRIEDIVLTGTRVAERRKAIEDLVRLEARIAISLLEIAQDTTLPSERVVALEKLEANLEEARRRLEEYRGK